MLKPIYWFKILRASVYAHISNLIDAKKWGFILIKKGVYFLANSMLGKSLYNRFHRWLTESKSMSEQSL